MFSKTFGHALRATTYIAIHGKDGQKVALQDLSEQLKIPHPFLGKIMQELVRHGILDSAKGPKGGFFINESTLDISPAQILKITDGTTVFDQCAMGLKHCNPAHPCLLHHDFAICRNAMLKTLEEKTIQELTSQTETAWVFLV